MLPRVAREYGHHLVRSVYQSRNELALHAGQADGETCREAVNAMS